jgi:hypothetical protein
MRLAIALLFCVVLAGNAEANDFVMAMSGCTPSMEEVYPRIYVVGDGWISSTATPASNLVRYFCPISRTIAAPTMLKMLVNRQGTDSITAGYFKKNKNFGPPGDVILIANISASSTGISTVTSVPFSDVYDQSTFVYWVEVGLSQSTSGGLSKVFYVSVF